MSLEVLEICPIGIVREIMNGIMEVKNAVVKRLREDATLMAKVQAVFDREPEVRVFPYVMVADLQSANLPAHEIWAEAVTGAIEIYAKQNKDRAIEAIGIVQTLVHQFEFGLEGFENINSRVILVSIEDAREKDVFKAVVEFRIVIQEI